MIATNKLDRTPLTVVITELRTHSEIENKRLSRKVSRSSIQDGIQYDHRLGPVLREAVFQNVDGIRTQWLHEKGKTFCHDKLVSNFNLITMLEMLLKLLDVLSSCRSEGTTALSDQSATLQQLASL